MKMKEVQFLALKAVIDHELWKMNLTRLAICSLGDCWILLTRFLVAAEYPIGYGNSRDYIFPGLNDSHIETAFRKMMKEVSKEI